MMERTIVVSGGPPPPVEPPPNATPQNIPPQHQRPVIQTETDRNLLRTTASWVASVSVIVAIHGALFWYLTREPSNNTPPVPVEPAAVMVDMAPEVQQAFSQNDTAVGQPMQEAADQPPPPPEPVTDPIPKIDPSPVDPVAPLPPKPPEKPKIEKPPKKIPPKPKKPVTKETTKAAAKTASAPRSDNHAARTTSSSVGAAASPAAISNWSSQVKAAIDRNKRSTGSQTGVVTLRMAVAASGALSSAGVVASSGFGELDSAALSAVRSAAPFPPPPGGAKTVSFHVVFRGGSRF